MNKKQDRTINDSSCNSLHNTWSSGKISLGMGMGSSSSGGGGGLLSSLLLLRQKVAVLQNGELSTQTDCRVVSIRACVDP